ncbi:MAG TPA: DUF2892 domain-containing protein [Gammaproteobacteria bacterium]|jgi:hypothetical protein|nr:DUF2892 domain-containing protein [Gammaproteobacteria bacterium]HIL42947.1 DUF2892 domain-containing protein [Gammaproteobacteria bacterium]
MTINNAVMALAGFMVIVSLTLGSSISPFMYSENFLWLTAFVGINLFQSSFTGFCPAANIFKALGLKSSSSSNCCS